MRVPWTLKFLRQYLRYLTPLSALRLRRALLREAHGRAGVDDVVLLRIRKPVRMDVALRPSSADMDTFSEILVDGIYREACGYLDRPKRIIDIGANIGLATMYFASRYPGCRLVAVEPSRRNLPLLNRNVAGLVCAGRCVVVPAAIWPEDGRVILRQPPEAGQFNQDAVRAAAPGEMTDGMNAVPGIQLGRLVREYGGGPIDLLKIDIEGAERDLFGGDTSWLRQVRTLAIEFHGDSRVASGFDVIMAAHGFRVIDTGGHTVIAKNQTSGWSVG